MKTMEGFNFEKFTDPSGIWYEIGTNTSEVSAGSGIRNMGKPCENKIIGFSRKDNVTQQASTSVTSFINACYINGKKVGSIEGKISVSDPLVQSRMSISFPGVLGKTSKYWVYDTDYTNYAIVGNDTGKYWILSRESKICPNDHYSYLNKLKSFGFDVSKERINLNVLKDCQSK